MKGKTDKTYLKLVQKMQEVSVVPPQDVGPFTSIYKTVVSRLKFYPWKLTLLLSFLTSFILYFLFGAYLVELASILQFGF